MTYGIKYSELDIPKLISDFQAKSIGYDSSRHILAVDITMSLLDECSENDPLFNVKLKVTRYNHLQKPAEVTLRIEQSGDAFNFIYKDITKNFDVPATFFSENMAHMSYTDINKMVRKHIADYPLYLHKAITSKLIPALQDALKKETSLLEQAKAHQEMISQINTELPWGSQLSEATQTMSDRLRCYQQNVAMRSRQLDDAHHMAALLAKEYLVDYPEKLVEISEYFSQK